MSLPGSVGLPDEIPARSSARFACEKTELESKALHGQPFPCGDTVKVTVVNSFYHPASATAQVLDCTDIFPRSPCRPVCLSSRHLRLAVQGHPSPR